MEKNYPHFNFFYFLIFLFFTVFSIKGNAQCAITSSINASALTCGTSPLASCNVLYIGDGTNAITLTMNNDLDLTCLGSIQLIIRNAATIYFQSSYRLTLAVGSSIVIESGGNLAEGTPCSASQRIYIGTNIVSSCNGNGGADTDFNEIVIEGGYNTVKTTISPSSVCGSGIFSIAESVTPTPIASTTYNWYSAASDGTAIATQTSSASPYSSTYTTGTLSSTTTYYVSATTGSNTTPRKAVTLIVNPLPTAPTVGTITQPTCATATGSVLLSGLPTGTWTLTRNPGGITSTGTGTSTTISSLATGTYTYTVTNANGCISSASANVVINSQPTKNYWTGATNSDWNIPGNWCKGVPTLGFPNTLDVVIPAGLTNYPIIYAGDPSGYVENILFENNTTLNVRENSLRVKANLTLNGKIDLEGESQLLQDTGSVFDALSTGTIEIDQQGIGNSFRYNYWSSPVNSRGTKYTIGEVLRDGTNSVFSIIDFGASHTYADGVVQTSPIKLSTYWMYVLRNSGFGYSAWFRVGNTGEIAVGEGYTMKGSNTSAATQNYTFVGKPNNGDITLPLTADFDYLVGNPYPSAIDAWQFITNNTTSIDGAIYFWEHYGGDTHNLAGYQGGYGTINLSSTIGVSASSNPPVAGVSTLGASVKGGPGRFIPIGQAFFVVGKVNGGQIQFNNSQRIFVKESSGNSIFMKTNNTASKTANNPGDDLRPKFRIGFDAPKISHRQLLLTIDEGASKGVDWGFDAEIYEIFADDMYWMLEGKKYVIQATNTIGLNTEVPVGLQLSVSGMVTVKIDALENVDKNIHVFLKDNVTGESHDITSKPIQLNLVAGKYANRFALTFKVILIPDKNALLMDQDVLITVKNPLIAEDVSMVQNEQALNIGIHVFMNNSISELQINNVTNSEILSINLFNNVGQLVNSWNTNLNKRDISLPIHKSTGIYNVQIITKNGTTVKKIMVE